MDTTEIDGFGKSRVRLAICLTEVHASLYSHPYMEGFMPTPNGGKRVGYIRVSTIEQNVGRQLEGIQLDKTFTEFASGKDTNRPQLQLMLDYLREGDHLLVHSLDRLARSLLDLRKLIDELTARGVTVEFMTERMIFNGKDTALGTLLLNVMGGFAEFERAMLRERQAEGIAMAKKRGQYKGRKPSISGERLREAKASIAAGVSKAKVARDLGISRETLYAYLGEHGEAMAAKFDLYKVKD